MKYLVRTAVIAGIVVTLGTAAFAIAETGSYPGAERIPVVVVPIAAAVESSAAPEAVGSSTLPTSAATPDSKPSSGAQGNTQSDAQGSGLSSTQSGTRSGTQSDSQSSGQKSTPSQSPQIDSSKNTETKPPESTKKSSGDPEPEHEVVTPRIRDSHDEHPPEVKTEKIVEPQKASSDSGQNGSAEPEKKN
jgi:hypothetical protein